MTWLLYLLIYLTIGALAGFLSGLFGIGGGLVIVPILISVFTFSAFPPELIMASAVATSLATIIFTGLASTKTHHQNNHVIWPIVFKFSPGFLIASFIGTFIMSKAPALWMQLAFAGFAMLVAVNMFISTKREAESLKLEAKTKQSFPLQASSFRLSFIGLIIGTLSTLFGIGGGTLTVPFLRHQTINIKKAIGTSAACGVPIAFFASIFYAMATLPNVENTPEFMLGYIYLPAMLGIIFISPLTAKFGANLVNTLDKNKLQKAFALLLIFVSLRLFYSALF